jgi:hypothetical protein
MGFWFLPFIFFTPRIPTQPSRERLLVHLRGGSVRGRRAAVRGLQERHAGGERRAGRLRHGPPRAAGHAVRRRVLRPARGGRERAAHAARKRLPEEPAGGSDLPFAAVVCSRSRSGLTPLLSHVSRSDIRLILTFLSAQCLMVRRWRLIGYFPILYNPTPSSS